MDTGILLGFIVSKHGIIVGPLKVEEILQLPLLNTILQGKANFLKIFVLNHAEIAKGFIRLLKQYAPFIWDDQAQCSFVALNK